MKITFQIPKADAEKQAKLFLLQWVKLKEPKSHFIAILFSVPFMVLGGAIAIILTRIFLPVSMEDYGFQGGSITLNFNILTIISILLLVLIHELIHLILIPNFLKSTNTGIGIHFGGFVYTEEIMSRMRYILISIAPFLVLSIVLPLILGAFGCLNPTIIFLIFLNALGSSVDLLNVTLILSQVPKKAKIINNVTSTLWRSM
ncbi:DUF3267 domain-containing protein [Paenibacillus montanisoli]|uniref:DUF3267 domain-containing protein n=1 Tax=Paenibacillus montanisoli TaxID=2081970 RepID=A0A328U381_9BACL|nr:DUF3267 domain-containing protein [Paenibacillus montanisoli]RAP77268.1 DUF3267 domain-containing protein [Paenibacillus montanisoli]